MTGTSVAYFAPDVTQGSVIKRIACFLDEGFEVTSFTFRRDRPTTFQPPCRNVDLGAVPNEQYMRRMVHTIGTLRRLWSAREQLQRAQVYYARMLDSALIALLARRLFNPSAHLYYEVCDIRRIMMNPGAAGRIARALERRILAACRRLVVNSPNFVSAFFEPRQGFHGSSFLLENKIYAKDFEQFEAFRNRARSAVPNSAFPLVVAWFGNLDDPVTWETIKSVARRFPEKVKFYLRGYPIVDQNDFCNVVENYPNIEFGGPFNNLKDLADMYARAHLVLGLDLMNQEGNSWWLLPNSLYEAGAFCRPLITSEGTATAERISQSGTGWVLKEPVEASLLSLIDSFSWTEYHEIEMQIAAIDPRAYAGQDQFRILADLIRSDVADRDVS